VTYPRLTFEVGDEYRAAVGELPWAEPIGRWRELGVKHLNVRRGQGRHPVVFVRAGSLRLVVKELGIAAARAELASYRRLQELRVPTLEPVGCVARESAPIAVASPVGTLYEPDVAGHSLTLLARRVLPDSRLYSLALKPERRRLITDAVAELFVDLHSHGVYWGDASLDNLLIQFVQVDIPQIGRRTRLRALLADAETVEVHPSLSPGMRAEDLDHFVDSMRWLNEDLRLQGMVRETLATERDQEQLLGSYERRYAATLEARAFAEATGLDPSATLGEVESPAYWNALRKSIDEHRWYLSEREGGPVELERAAADWLERVFLPVCEAFRRFGVTALFPGKTAAELYVDVMRHKYYLSRAEGRDVGVVPATRDYAERFGAEPPLAAFWRGLVDRLGAILGFREAPAQSPPAISD